jgi:phosphomannomutase
MPYEHGRMGALTQLLEASFPGAAFDRSDGIKVMLSEGWIHVRPSNTEPVVRLAAEARSEAQLAELMERAERLLHQ